MKVNYVGRHRRPKLSDSLAVIKDFVDEVHSACLSVAEMGPRDFDNLVDSIKKHGLIEPIKINRKRQLLDGRCRVGACFVAGISIPAGKIVVTHESPEAIAQSNIARRHLTRDQKIMDAAKRLEAAQINSERSRASKLNKGQQIAKLPVGANPATTGKQSIRKIRSIEKVAKEEGVSRQQLRTAQQLRKTDVTLAKKVEDGEVGLDEAATAAGISKPRKTAKAVVKSKVKQPVLFAKKHLKVELISGDVRLAKGKHASIVYGTRTNKEALVHKAGSSWLFYDLDGESNGCIQFDSRDEAELAARIAVE